MYGVRIPGTDGRAGMAALVVDSTFDIDRFHDVAAERLPPYARPVFLRLVAQVASTSTFRPIKREMAEAGFDPSRIDDALFFANPTSPRYIALDRAAFLAIQSGAIRF